MYFPHIPASLPSLLFKDKAFDLVLVSHFLFLYAEHQTLEFTQQSILELIRIAREIRIFPLVELSGKESSHLLETIDFIKDRKIKFELLPVKYEFQKGANTMLRILTDSNF